VARSQRSKILIALAGEYYVASQLCLRGYVASLTLKNYPDVDIFCLNPMNGRQCALQVKTSTTNDFFVPRNCSEGNRLFAFVHITKNNSLEVFIVPGKQVDEIAQAQTDEYLERARQKRRNPNPDQLYMVSVKNICQYRDRWDLLGIDDPIEH